MRATVQETLARIPLHRATASRAPVNPKWPEGEPFALAFARGSLIVELFAPRDADRQTPHTRDELYVIVAGRGEFVHGDRRDAFGPGDVFFVPAFMEHRFENFTDDFITWVIFYGPEGGEVP
jgi:mannose-6-phosphate isomerase-like protein (cupin superfamily)